MKLIEFRWHTLLSENILMYKELLHKVSKIYIEHTELFEDEAYMHYTVFDDTVVLFSSTEESENTIHVQYDFDKYDDPETDYTEIFCVINKLFWVMVLKEEWCSKNDSL